MNGLLSERARLLVFLVVCAALHPAKAADGASVYSLGDNSRGATGLGTTSGDTLVATPINTANLGGRAIKQVAVGYEHSLLLAENGRVFSFGSNSQGQTGLGLGTPFGLGNTPVATPIDASNLGGRAIKQLAAGYDHSLLLAEDGSVYSSGNNEFGQTGLGTPFGNTWVATPIDASNLGGRKITQVATGFRYSLLLAEDGGVFSFGWNKYGPTGLGTDVGNTLIATPIDASNLGGRKIAQVAAGFSHSLLLAEDGSVFSFGRTSHGETGLGTDVGNTLVATPIDASNLGGRKITQVAAGSNHSLLLAEDRSVFSFGWNSQGQTGLGTDFSNTLVATPIDASNLGGRKITQVDAGDGYNFLLAEDGSVFSFGGNYQGRTGLGTDSGNTLVATPIENPDGLIFTQVAASFTHSLLIGVPEPGALSLISVALVIVPGSIRRQAVARRRSRGTPIGLDHPGMRQAPERAPVGP